MNMIKIRKAPVGMPDAERQEYIRYMTERHPEIASGTLDIIVDGDDVELTLTPDTAVKFQRIRRITGYLTGTVDRWNNAKKAELADRAKHGGIT